MLHRLALVARGTLIGMGWGALSSWLYGSPLHHGLAVGIAVWGPCSFVAVPGPYAPTFDDLLVHDLDDVIDLPALELEERLAAERSNAPRP